VFVINRDNCRSTDMVLNSQNLKSIHIVDAKCGFGRVAVDIMGFDCPETGGRTMLLRPIDYDNAICAHAPSELTVEVLKPVEVAAAANASFKAEPVRAWINWHMVGELRRGSDVTPWIKLAPGEYKLWFECNSKSYAHTLWLVKRSSASRAAERLAVITAGFYEQSQLPDKLNRLFRSAARRGTLLWTYGVGKKYESYTQAKIVDLIPFIESLPTSIDTVVFTDGIDSFLIDDGDGILERLERHFPEQVVVSGVDYCWPIRGLNWAEMFLRPLGIRAALEGPFIVDGKIVYPFINVGEFGGPRAAVLDVLRRLNELFTEVLDQQYDDRVASVIANGAETRPYIDEYLWQVAHAAGLIQVTVDIEWKVFVCLRSKSLVSPRFKLCREGDAIYFETPEGHRPAIIHIPGSSKRALYLWDGLCSI